MNSWLFALLIIGLWPMLRRYLVARNFLGFRFPIRSFEIVSVEELPKHQALLMQPIREELESQGFQLDCCQRTDVGVVGDEVRWSLIYLQRESGCYGIVEMSMEVNRIGRADVDFATHFSDEKLILTSPSDASMIGEDPLFDRETLKNTSLGEMLVRHQSRVAAYTNEAREPVVFSAEDFALVRAAYGNSQLEALAKSGALVRGRDEGIWRLSWKEAWRCAGSAIRNSKLSEKELKSKVPAGSGSPPANLSPDVSSARLESEVDAFLFSRKVSNTQGGGGFDKLIILLFSIGLFLVWLNFTLSFETILILFLVLLVHESGHLFGMWLFGYRNLQMLFLPFFGAVAIGAREQAKPWQELIVLLLGPLPGLVAGIALLVTTPYDSMPFWMKNTTVTLLLLNGFNLLPIYPMDGGQLMRLAFFARFPILGAIFSLGSALVLCLLGFFGKMWGIGILGCLMLAGTARNFRSAVMVQAIRKLLWRPYLAPERDVAREVLRRLDDPSFARSFTRKFLSANPIYVMLRAPVAGFGTAAVVALMYLSPIWIPLAAWPVVQSIGERRMASAREKIKELETNPKPQAKVVDFPPLLAQLQKKILGRAGEASQALAELASARFGYGYENSEDKLMEDSKTAYASELTGPLLEDIMKAADEIHSDQLSLKDRSTVQTAVLTLLGAALVEADAGHSDLAGRRIVAAWRLALMPGQSIGLGQSNGLVPFEPSQAAEWFLRTQPLPSRPEIEAMLALLPDQISAQRAEIDNILAYRRMLEENLFGEPSKALARVSPLFWYRVTPLDLIDHARFLEETAELAQLRSRDKWDPKELDMITPELPSDSYFFNRGVRAGGFQITLAQMNLNRLRLVRGAFQCYLARLDAGHYPDQPAKLDPALEWKERSTHRCALTLSTLTEAKVSDHHLSKFDRIEFELKPEA